MKIQLIRPPLDNWYEMDQFTEQIAPPVGLLLLKSAIGDLSDVQIVDGLYKSLDEVVDSIDGDFVGVSSIYSNYGNALKILEEAKKRGARTIIGGSQPTNLASRVLRNRDYIDFVVVGDGEEALPLLVSGKNLDGIPNLIYRKQGKIIQTPRRDVSLDLLFDLEGLEEDSIRLISPDKPFPISSIRGCIKAQRYDRCTFCSINHSVRVMKPSRIWDQIRILNGYGLEYFFETGDSFFVGQYPQMLLAERPSDLSQVRLRMYTSPNQITEENIEVLVGLNVPEIFLGIESTNDGILEEANKGYRRKDIIRAVELLKKNNIRIHVPFLYGLPGETPESAEKTFRYAEELAGKDISKIISSLPVPFFGTRLFTDIQTHEKARKEYPGDLDNDDIFDYQSLVRLQLQYFTSVSFDEMLELVQKTKALSPDPGSTTSFGINK